MNRKRYAMLNRSGLILLVVLLLSLMSGCTTTVLTPGYRGDKIQAGYRIPINSGEHGGVYRTNDLSVNYRYTQKGNDLKISGTVSFASGTLLNFRYIDYFNLSLLVADSEGAILANDGLVSTSWVNLTGSDNQVQFSDSVKLPANSVVMAFTYTGQASEGGLGGGDDTGGGNTQFWQYPVVR